ncbi:MAG: sulfatase [Planctomycetota bacterium]
MSVSRLAAFVIATVHSFSAFAAPLNVLLIVVDDYGWADMSPNNPDIWYETPQLAAFAKTAANFERGYASPVCSPSRVSIMAGVNPVLDGATEWFWNQPGRSARYYSADRINFLPNHRRTIAEYLRDAGYQTLFVGKWHLGGAGRHLPQARGYDTNVAGARFGSPGRGGFFAPYSEFIGLEAPEGEHLPRRLTDETIAWLSSRDQSRPFFATLSYYSVHTPLQGREDLVAKYTERRDAMGLTDEDRFEPIEQVWPSGAPRRVRVEQDHAVYAAMVEAMDEHIGRLLGAIDDLGLAENTLVIFVSDNGGLSTAEGSPTSNLPLRGGKGWLYEGGIRVPFMVRWPGVSQAGSTITTPMHTSDILPSILDAAEVPPPPDAQHEGRSMRAGLQGRATDRRLFFHYPHYANQGGFPGGVVIDGRYKYVLRYEDGRGHLYDIENDKAEQHDIEASEPAIASELRTALVDWLTANGAHMLSPKRAGDRPWTLADR